MKRNKSPKKRTIKIALSPTHWIDMTNDLLIGDAQELIEYVNTWNIVVENEDCFLQKDKFWYNKE